jgi:hypothetical protein
MRDDSYARCVRTFSEGTTISLEASLDSSDVRWILRGSFRRLKPSNAISSRAAQPTFEEASMIPHQHQRATRARLGHATALGPITILAWLALLPAVAHAQATIAGDGERYVGRHPARRDRRGHEPCPHREGSFRRHRRRGTVPHREPAARRVHGYLRACRVLLRCAARVWS